MIGRRNKPDKATENSKTGKRTVQLPTKKDLENLLEAETATKLEG
jgi:hypothetical protein